MVLNILVIHGYVQSADTVAYNTRALRSALSDVAKLHYVDGPPMENDPLSGSRPWWYLGRNQELNPDALQRWNDTVSWWSEELSRNQYDGIIGLSQGAAMTGLLLSMLNEPSKVPGFHPRRLQPIKFAIMCSGFVSSFAPHRSLYMMPQNIPTMHTVDYRDSIVSAEETLLLQRLFKNSILLEHQEGHSVPVRGNWPKIMRNFIIASCPPQSPVALSPVAESSPESKATAKHLYRRTLKLVRLG